MSNMNPQFLRGEGPPEAAIRNPKFLVQTLFLIFLFSGLAGMSAVASSEPRGRVPKEEADVGVPIRITSDAVDSDHRMKWVEFTGNVRATQEDVVITADRIKIFYKLDGDGSGETTSVEKIISQGNVRIVFDNKTKTAAAEKAVYCADKKVLVLSGGWPTVWSGKNIIQGEKITIFQADNRTLVEGDGKKQVEATFYTEGKEGVLR